MARMKRKQIYLEEQQERQLHRLARRRGVTESALIRQGINRILTEPTPSQLDPGAWKEELAVIDSLIAKGPIKGARTWKREDLYER